MARKTRKSKKKLLMVSVPLSLVLVGGLLLFIHHRHRVVSGTIPSTTPSKTNKVSLNSSSADNSTATSNPKDASSGGGSGSVADDSKASATTLLAPSGAFVSNHSPNSGDAEQSVCNTTPGATCTIKFVNKDGVVKTLSAQTTDSSGAAYWTNWDVNGFGVGSWTITATASLNGQSKSTNDSLTLNVQS